jgi:hypothetical protein
MVVLAEFETMVVDVSVISTETAARKLTHSQSRLTELAYVHIYYRLLSMGSHHFVIILYVRYAHSPLFIPVIATLLPSHRTRLSRRRDSRGQTISHLHIAILAEHALSLEQIGLHAGYTKVAITSTRLARRRKRRLRTPRPHLLHSISLRLNIAHLSTLPTLPRFRITFKLLHSTLNLCPQIRAMETSLMHLRPAILTIPPQTIHTALRSRLLNHHTNRIRETHRIMRHIARQEEQFALVDVDVAELVGRGLDGFEEHAAFVLVEEFGSAVDVVVCAGVGAADDHDGQGIVVDQVVVDWGFEEVGICF